MPDGMTDVMSILSAYLHRECQTACNRSSKAAGTVHRGVQHARCTKGSASYYTHGTHLRAQFVSKALKLPDGNLAPLCLCHSLCPESCKEGSQAPGVDQQFLLEQA